MESLFIQLIQMTLMTGFVVQGHKWLGTQILVKKYITNDQAMIMEGE